MLASKPQNVKLGSLERACYTTVMHIAIVGCLGVGKSQLTKALADHLGYRGYYEPVKENPYLDDFYADPKRHAAIMQFFMLTSRFRQHLEIQDLQQHGISALQDQTIFGDVLYGQLTHEFGFMTDRDYATYKDHFEALRPMLRLPDVVIHLAADTDMIAQRVLSRGREAERGIDAAYLRRLSELFAIWVNSVRDKTSVIELDWNSFQPVEDVVARVEKDLAVQLRLPVVAPSQA